MHIINRGELCANDVEHSENNIIKSTNHHQTCSCQSLHGVSFRTPILYGTASLATSGWCGSLSPFQNLSSHYVVGLQVLNLEPFLIIIHPLHH